MAISGKTGSATNANGATQVKEWTLNEVQEPLDITNFDGSGWREFVEGLQSASGSLTVVGNRPTTGDTTTDLQLDVSATTGALRFTGAAILGSVDTTTNVEGVVEFSVDFMINGVLSVTTVP